MKTVGQQRDDGAVMEWLGRFRAEWLRDAELSVRSGEGVRGLSFFFRELAELRAWAEVAGVSEALVAEADAVTRSFEVVPRFWFKLGWDGERVCSVTRYYAVDRSVENPLTSLRLLLRKLGCTDVSWVKPAFEPFLEEPGVGWFVSGQRRGGDSVARLSCRVEASRWGELAARVVAHGLAEPALAALPVPPCDRVYLTVAARRAADASVDFRVSVDPPRYRKGRVRGGREPEWTDYTLLQEWLRSQGDLSSCSGNKDEGAEPQGR